MNQAEITEKISLLDAWIKKNQPAALDDFSNIAGKQCSIPSMHAHIGKNNNTFVDIVRTQFHSPDEFISRWIEGLQGRLTKINNGERKRYEGRIFSEEIIFRALQEELLKTYILKFLERNFYRNFQARIRAKPDDNLWSIWFGSQRSYFGLVISPTRRKNEWTIDKSQMRREKYHYWTIGHALSTGFIEAHSSEKINFQSISDLLKFYQTNLKNASNSQYERKIFDKYIEYVESQINQEEIPLLIPELRYAGKETKHKHRLDFSILNSHTSTFTGFELSPASTHIRAKGIKEKTEYSINQQLSKDWEKEVDKRNDYFESYGITTITFADRDLSDTDYCFSKIKHFLDIRENKKVSASEALEKLLRSVK